MPSLARTLASLPCFAWLVDAARIHRPRAAGQGLAAVLLVAAVADAQTTYPPTIPDETIPPHQKWLDSEEVTPPQALSTSQSSVILANGNFHHEVTDLRIPGPNGFDLVFTRVYRSGSTVNSALGNHWDFSWNESITLGFTTKPNPTAQGGVYGSQEVLYPPPGGTFPPGYVAPYEFTFDGCFYFNGQQRSDEFKAIRLQTEYGEMVTLWRPAAGYFSALKHVGEFKILFDDTGVPASSDVPDSFIMRGHDGTIRKFEEVFGDIYKGGMRYRITQITDRFGNTQRFEYETLTAQDVPHWNGALPAGHHSTYQPGGKRLKYVYDAYLHKITLNYDDFGWLASVVDHEGRVYQYGHAEGNLTSVTTPSLTGPDPAHAFSNGRTTLYRYATSAAVGSKKSALLEIVSPAEYALSGPSGRASIRNEYTGPNFETVARQWMAGDDGATAGSSRLWLYAYKSVPPLAGTAAKPFPPSHLIHTEAPPPPGAPPPPPWTPPGASWALPNEGSRTLAIDPAGNVRFVVFNRDGGEILNYQLTGRINPATIPTTYGVDLFEELLSITQDPDTSKAPVVAIKGAYRIEKMRTSDPDAYLVRKFFNSAGLVTREEHPDQVILNTYNSAAIDAFQRGNLLIRQVMPVAGPGVDEYTLPRQSTWYAYEPIYNQVRATVDARGAGIASGGTFAYQPQNGGSATILRYLSETIFDYQESALDVPAILDQRTDWGIDVGQQSQSNVFDPLGWTGTSIQAHVALGNVNGDGTVAQSFGNAVLQRSPSAQVYLDPASPTSGYTAQASVTRHSYNAYGFPLWSDDELGNRTEYEYWPVNDPEGDGAPIAPPPGYSFPFTPLPGGQGGGYLKKVIRPLGQTEEFCYDKFGNQNKRKDPRGFEWHTTWNEIGEQLQTTDPLGHLVQWIYNANGVVVQGKRQHKTPEIDGLGYPTGNEVNGATGVWIVDTFAYNLINQVVEERIDASTLDAQGQVVAKQLITRHAYDHAGKRILTLAPMSHSGEGAAQPNNVTATVYDERGLVYSQTIGGLPSNFSSLLGNTGVGFQGATAGSTASTTRTDYTVGGLVAKVTDALGRETAYEYDEFLRERKVTDALGNYTQRTWDIVGQQIDTQVFEATSGSSGTKISHTKTRYDERGRTYQTDTWIAPLGTSAAVDVGPMSSEAGFATSRTFFDAKGRATKTIDANGVVRESTYDALDRVVAVVDALGNRTDTTYNAGAQPIKFVETEKNAQGGTAGTYTSRLFYDPLGRLVAMVSPSGLTTRIAYDSLGRRVWESDGAGAVTAAMSSLVGASEHGGLPGTAINSPGNTKRYFFDAADRQARIDRHLRVGGVGGAALDLTKGGGDGTISTRTTYDANGRVVAEIDDDGNATAHAYNDRNWKVSTTYADGTQEYVSVFDAVGNAQEKFDANGTRTTSAYDALNRVTSNAYLPAAGVAGNTAPWSDSSLALLNETFEYDAAGRVTRAADGDVEVSRRYDTLGNLLREDVGPQTGGVLGLPGSTYVTTALYDALGQTKSIQYPGGRTMHRGFDAINRLSEVWDSQSVTRLARYEYEGPGRVVRRFNDRNGTTLGIAFDSERRVSGTQTFRTGSGVLIDDRSYIYDRRSNKTVRHDNLTQLDQQFEYDSFSRLLHSAWTPPQSIGGGVMVPTDYALDGVGNRESVSVSAIATSYTADNDDAHVNQYTSVGAVQRTHDSNGNLTQVVGGAKPATIVYDARNRMVEYRDDATGKRHQYRYDAFGRRISKVANATAVSGAASTTRYAYAKEQVIEERDSTGAVLATFVHGKGLDDVLVMSRGGGEHYYVTDDLGSVVKLLDAGGNTEERYEYGDYGLLLDGATLQPLGGSTIGNPRFYTGRDHDWETGLHQHRKRYMDPAVGRFTTRDPIGIWGDKLNVGNGYTYAGNNPWTLTDRTGLDWSISGAWDSVCDAASGVGDVIRDGAAGVIDGGINAVTFGMVETTVGADMLGADTSSMAYAGGNIAGQFAGSALLSAATAGAGGVVGGALQLAGHAGDIVDIARTGLAVADKLENGDLGGALATAGGAVAGNLVGRAIGGSHADGGGGSHATDINSGHCAGQTTCFVAGTLVMTSCGFTPIERVRLGDRVLTPSAVIDDTDVDPATWRQIDLVIHDGASQGRDCAVSLLRPDAWLAALEWSAEGLTWVDLEEVGVHGWATIERVVPCPAIEGGRGRVVTALFRSVHTDVQELSLAGTDERIQPTWAHRIYSRTRHAWIPAGLLVDGEALQSLNHAARLATRTPIPGAHAVFNLEVEREHVYLVSESGILVHNTCGDTLNGGTRLPNDSLAAAPPRRGAAPIGNDGNPVELHHRDQSMGNDSALDEMTRTDHRGGDNFSRNHSNTGQSGSNVDRAEFRQQREEHWQNEYDSGRFDALPPPPEPPSH